MVGTVLASLASLTINSVHAAAAAPPLPPPTGPVVHVASEPQLQAAVRASTSGTTIVLAPGTYVLTRTLYFNGTFTSVTLRGATDNRDDVVLVGRGMTNPSYGEVPHGIWTGGNVTGFTIANLTIRDVWDHPIIFNGGTHQPRVYNVRVINAGQQFLKANPDGAGGGVNGGRVEYSAFEYTTTARGSYTNGVDVHTGRDWIIRHNLFLRIRAPQGALAGPAILIWNGSSGTLVEGNTFVDCQREINLGLDQRTPDDHTGGIVRNNFIYRSADVQGAWAIGIFDSPGTQVLHNSIFIQENESGSIEYRFPDTTNVQVLHNLADRPARARDGATANVAGNVWSATADFFVDPSRGDLHLRPSATSAIDQASGSFDVPLDWDGESRPSGGAADVGADELLATAPPPPPPAPSVSPGPPPPAEVCGDGRDNDGDGQVDDGCAPAPAPPAPPPSVDVSGAPTGVRVALEGTRVVLSWEPPAGEPRPVAYIVRVGLSPGAIDYRFVSFTTSLTGNTPPPGTYYIRVFAAHESRPYAGSEEIVLRVP